MVRNSRRGAINDDYGNLILDLDALFERVGKLESPSGEASGGALAKTNSNIAELLTRVTLSNEAIYTRTVTLAETVPVSTPELAAIDFTLTERRRIYVRTSCYMSMIALNDGSVVVDPYALAYVNVTMYNIGANTSTLLNTPTATGAGFISGLRTMARSAQRVFLDDYQILNPGTYRAVVWMTATQMDGTLVSITFTNPRLAVEIMEKA